MIVVTGATGALGTALLPHLTTTGQHVVGLSRRPRPGSGASAGVEWRIADLNTGAGLDVLREADTVVHLASDPRSKVADIVQAKQVIAACRRDTHLVYISIVGVDRHPFGYYQNKFAVERLLADRPHTILRATQFHGFVAAILYGLAKSPVMPYPARTSDQPVAVEAVAQRLAQLALGAPAGRVADLGGPQVLTFAELARSYLRAAGKRRALLPVTWPGKVGRAFRDGAHLLEPGADVAGQTWQEYLDARFGGA